MDGCQPEDTARAPNHFAQALPGRGEQPECATLAGLIFLPQASNLTLCPNFSATHFFLSNILGVITKGNHDCVFIKCQNTEA